MNKLFLDSKNRLNDFFYNENIRIPENVSNKLLALISILTVYEEEEVKIFPKLVIGNKISLTLKKFLTNSHILHISSEDMEGKEFEKKIKALIPFCNMGWHVLIDINYDENEIFYGIVRSYTGISGLDLQSQIFNGITEPLNLIFIETIDKSSLTMQGIKDHILVDFKLYDDTTSAVNSEVIDNLCKDLVSDIEGEKYREEVARVFSKFFKTAQKKIHGTILLVTDYKNTKVPETLMDGNWFKQDDYLDIADSAIKVLSVEPTHEDIEKHYSLTGLLISMMNIDGITIINSKGQIIAYNVFLKQNFNEEQVITGGARKRTAMSLKLLHNENYKIKGVYFQSQDGNTYYERVDN